MKKSIIFIILSLIIKFAQCQSFEFKSYGLMNSYSGNNVINAQAKLIITKNDSKYEIEAFDPRDGSLSMDCNVTYLKTDDISGSYIYKGEVKIGQIEYGCILSSLTKLSDFTKGIGNTDNFLFKEVYQIKITYGNKNSNPYNYNERISIYPLNLGLLNTKVPDNYVKPEYDEWIKDIDGNEYPIVNIGNQVWMAKNLAVTHFRNGDEISFGMEDSDWRANRISYCNVNMDSLLVESYGRLYKHYVVTDTRNVCPTGWHIPSEMEWNKLFDYLGGESIAGGKLKMVGNEHWLSINNGGTNESQFSAVGAGVRIPSGVYFNFGEHGYFWTPKVTYYDSKGKCVAVKGKNEYVYITEEDREYGLSIRCIKN